MFMSHCQTSGQNHNIKTSNKLFENVGMTVANNNCILHSGIACYNSFQKLLPSDLLHKTEIFKINIKAVTFSVILYRLKPGL